MCVRSQVSAEHQAEVDPETDSDSEWDSDADPLREGGWYLSPSLRQRLQDEYSVESRTLLQFLGDAVIIPAGALHQVHYHTHITSYILLKQCVLGSWEG